MAAFEADWTQPPAQESAPAGVDRPADFTVPPAQESAFFAKRASTSMDLPGAGTRTYRNYARRISNNTQVEWRSVGFPDPAFAYSPVAASLLQDHTFRPE